MTIRKQVPLREFTYYQIGGAAALVLEVYSVEDVREAILYLQHHAITKILVVGLGSNLIAPDEGWSGAVISFKENKNGVSLIKPSYLVTFAGTSLDTVLTYAFSHNLVGLGWAGGLPSSVGGAVRGNAGAFGHEMKDSVVEVGYLDSTDSQVQLHTRDGATCEFLYRDSYFKHHSHLLIVTVKFSLTHADTHSLEQEKNTYLHNIAYRQTHHPMTYPSCGSVFKNIVKKDQVDKIIAQWPDIEEKVRQGWYGKVSMAYVIGRLGFAGLRIGGAEVSSKHNNYISNIDHATANDVNSIIEQIHTRFLNTFHFAPELEVSVV